MSDPQAHRLGLFILHFRGRSHRGARATFVGLADADDDIVQLSQFSIPEKRAILTKVIAALVDTATSGAELAA